jgi:hydrogenase-4 component E
MITFLIVLFAFTLFYLSMAERFRSYASLIGIQGVLLFGIAFIELTEVNTLNLIFIVTETLLFKAIAVPLLLFRIINKTTVYRVHPKALPGFYSLLIAIGGLLLSIVLSDQMKDKHIDQVYFTIAIFALFTGILLIVTHRRIFSHMIGFLIIENAVFLFSLAIGSEMPFLINIGILLDIVVSVLIIGVFINRIGTKFNDLETENLTDLRH